MRIPNSSVLGLPVTEKKKGVGLVIVDGYLDIEGG